MSFIGKAIIADVRRPLFRAAIVLACAAAAGVAGLFAFQEQEQAPRQPTFRTSTNLVVIDAVVVDKDGRHIRDLRAEDFEVVQSGRPMPVRQVVYVESAAGATAPAPTDAAANRPPGSGLPIAPRRPSISGASIPQNARVIAVVIDDLGLSFESTYTIRRTLTKFVDEQIKAGDLVAILKTSTGAGALQQFTTDKRLLHAAIDRVRWTVFSRSGVSAFTPIVAPDATGAFTTAGSGTAESTNENTIEGLRTQMLAAGSLGALEFVIRGVESLPGRKSVVFVSEGMRLLERPEGSSMAGSGRVWRAFTRVMDRANRAGVVVYTMDPRGLATAGITAEDNPQPAPPPPGPGGGQSLSEAAKEAILSSAKVRHDFLMDSLDSLTYIAEQTGGFPVLNTNDLNRGFGRVLDDLAGYYLIGYEGVPSSVRSWDPGRVRVRVKRSGARVRSRRGLFGPADAARPAESASGDPLVDAAMSPFGANTIDVRVTGLFGHHPGKGSFLRSLFFIDPSALNFVPRDDGRHVAQITLALLAFGEDGQLTDHWRRLVDLQLSPDTYRRVRERGILYSASIPIKKAGGYQLRAAARDERTAAIGSSSQFVEVPRVGRNRLALSSIIMRSADPAARVTDPEPEDDLQEGLEDTVFGEPWVRIFKRGSEAVYSYEIYDGVTDEATTLTTTAVLMHEGRSAYEGPASPLRRVPRGRNVRVVPVAGRLSFSGATPPGTYTLQITVSQVRNNKVLRRVQQWATFEVR